MQKAEKLLSQILTLVDIIHEQSVQIQTAYWNNEKLQEKIESLECQVAHLRKELDDATW